MKEITLDDAQTGLFSVIEEAAKGDGSVILRHGKPKAVVISYEEFERLSTGAPSFGWLVSKSPLQDSDLPKRRAARVFGEDTG